MRTSYCSSTSIGELAFRRWVDFEEHYAFLAFLVHLLAAEKRYRSLISGQRPDDILKEGREPLFDELRARVESLAAFWDEQARDPRRLDRMIPSTWRGQEHTIKASVAVIPDYQSRQ